MLEAGTGPVKILGPAVAVGGAGSTNGIAVGTPAVGMGAGAMVGRGPTVVMDVSGAATAADAVPSGSSLLSRPQAAVRPRRTETTISP